MKECDLVMRGGITSGIVYPKALVALATEYRFKNVGGASAGAIAAAFAAAAEANREGDGFRRLDLIPDEFKGEGGLGKYFQPHAEHRKLFQRLYKRIEQGKAFGWWFIVKNIFGIRHTIKALPKTNFGFCPGTTTDRYGAPGLIDWLNRQLEFVAGRMDSPEGELPADPLTFGYLADRGISLRLITTNVSQRIPENLPIREGYKLRKTDLGWLMPENIRQWLLARPHVQLKGETALDNSFVNIPHDKDMPVLLAVRMSLSFPVLFMAVPVYALDHSLRIKTDRCDVDKGTLKLNYFLDGGLSSNFPIHYFDAPLPTRPTFGINLTRFHPCRSGEDKSNVDLWNRIYLPSGAGQGHTYGTNSVAGIAEYLMSLIDTAKDWQDSVQMRMPGYRERIVHIALKDNEGGMNLAMKPETINRLIDLGELAGRQILEGDGGESPAFDFEVHRWRRLLNVTEALEAAVTELVSAYEEVNPSGAPLSGSVKEMLEKLENDLNTNRDKYRKLGYLPEFVSDLQKLRIKWEAITRLSEIIEQQRFHPQWNLPSPKAEVAFRSVKFSPPAEP